MPLAATGSSKRPRVSGSGMKSSLGTSAAALRKRKQREAPSATQPVLPSSPASPPAATHKALKGFRPLLVQLHPPPSLAAASASASSSHVPARCLFYRPHHAVADDDGIPAERTLLVVNVPFYFTEREMTELFSCFGAVEQSVTLSSSITAPGPPASPADIPIPPPSHPYYRSARVIFSSAASVTAAMTVDLTGTVQPYVPPAASASLLHRLRASYQQSLPDVKVLREQIDRFMSAFDSQQKEEESARRRQAAQADEEGWTLVRRRGKRGREEAQQSAMEAVKLREEKRMRKLETVSFYRFQSLQKKESQLQELRRKFEEDKQRIAAMKQSRIFTPL